LLKKNTLFEYIGIITKKTSNLYTWSLEHKANGESFMVDIDASQYGNTARFVNDLDYHNAEILFSNHNGTWMALYIITEDIQPGE
jgi:hypothetical protein